MILPDRCKQFQSTICLSHFKQILQATPKEREGERGERVIERKRERERESYLITL